MSIVTSEDISLLPKRYAIGKRPLSILLGWGELTYTRMLEGNTPSPQHAAELRRYLDDPAAFARLLDIRRQSITDLAYARSMRAVNTLLESEGGVANATKIFAVADRLCVLAEGDLTPSALQRMTYYAQGRCFAKLGHAMFNDLPRAGKLGPTYARIENEYTFDEIQRVHADSPERETDERVLSSAELKIIDEVFGRYGDFSGKKLSQLSRSESPWRKARKRAGADAGEECDELITAKSMTKFFSKEK